MIPPILAMADRSVFRQLTNDFLTDEQTGQKSITYQQ